MGIGISILNDLQNRTLLLLAGANILIVVHLLAAASNKYLEHLPEHPRRADLATKSGRLAANSSRKPYIDARLRLDSFWMLAMVASVATVLKLVLPTDLADQLIAAWFVGQGFALQPYIQSYISGMAIRSNIGLWDDMYSQATLTYQGDTYELADPGLFTLRLRTKGNENTYRVVPWTVVESCVITRTS